MSFPKIQKRKKKSPKRISLEAPPGVNKIAPSLDSLETGLYSQEAVAAHPVHDGEAAVVTEENISPAVQEVLDLVGQTEYPGQEHRRPAVLHPPRVHIRPGLQQALHGPPAGVGDAVVQGGLLHTVNTVWRQKLHNRV